MTVAIHSEIDVLETLILSPPGTEFDWMTPDNLPPYRQGPAGLEANPDYLLFDDLVLLRKLQEEHGRLQAVAEAVLGTSQVLSFRDLLVQCLGQPLVRDEAILGVIEVEGRYYDPLPASLERKEAALRALDPAGLAETLFTGRQGRVEVLKWPAPNALFARDLMTGVGNSLLLSIARKPARMREMHLASLVAAHHPLFADVMRWDLREPTDAVGAVAVEGGDVLVLSPEVVCVGTGSRTTVLAAERLSQRLLDDGFQAALIVRLPEQRSAMHIDTLVTRIDEERLLVFPPMVQEPDSMGLAITIVRSDGRRSESGDLLKALKSVGLDLKPVFCGGDDPVAQRREQWSDGANAFALAPGVILAYARNEHTLAALGREGYRQMRPETFIEQADVLMRGGEKVVIALPGSELVRGRGGPRCLTLPLARRASS